MNPYRGRYARFHQYDGFGDGGLFPVAEFPLGRNCHVVGSVVVEDDQLTGVGLSVDLAEFRLPDGPSCDGFLSVVGLQDFQ